MEASPESAVRGDSHTPVAYLGRMACVLQRLPQVLAWALLLRG